MEEETGCLMVGMKLGVVVYFPAIANLKYSVIEKNIIGFMLLWAILRDCI